MLTRRVGRDESGLALIAVLLAMALITVIGAGLTAVGIVELRASINHRSATQALLLADAGATHAQALLRGPLESLSYTEVLVGDDGSPDTGDDGILMGFGLDLADQLPDTGVPLGDGRYFVQIVNDPGDPSGVASIDDNHRFVAVCRGETADGGVAEVRVMLAAPGFPAITSNGPLLVEGTPDIQGPCGGIHSNDTLTINGGPTAHGPVTSSDTVIMLLDAVVYDENGDTVMPTYEPRIEVPDLDPSDYCYAADFELHDGWVVTIDPSDASRDSSLASGSGYLGWKWNAATNSYTLDANDAVEGTVCTDGSVKVTGNLGSAADTFYVSILAEGSVEMGGTPVVKADHPEEFLILAEGDVKLSGNTAGTTPYFGGTVYAGSQCRLLGTPILDGSLLCYDDDDPIGSVDIADENKINGTPTITHDCSGKRRRTIVVAWWESRN
ncbi:MAG: hypothetical protein JSU87_07400 [Gemmatimonadota bacterium]|nr:MAG: hypothetical protein JSU87_07400 [Gemmatimonadota bacterium]